MFGRTSLLKAAALALPFSLAAAAAHAASIAETVQQHEELSTFAKAMAAAKLDQQLSAEGPYTVFAPTDQAFQQLPEGALEELLKQENQAQLTSLLEQHIIDGKAISAKEMLGQQSRIDAMSGEALTVDGTSQVVLLMPAQGEGQVEGQQAAAGTPTAQGSDMPLTEHQQHALKTHPAEEERQTAAQGAADMPATRHQQQVIQDQPGQGQAQGQQQAQGQGQTQGEEGQQAAAGTPTAQGSDMPMTEHQQQALRSHPAQEERQTAAQGAADMPATRHQQQVIQDQPGQGQVQGQQQAGGQEQPQGQEGQQQDNEDAAVQGAPDLLREASVVGAEIQADNGVIHVIDAVLLPHEVLTMLQAAKQG